MMDESLRNAGTIGLFLPISSSKWETSAKKLGSSHNNNKNTEPKSMSARSSSTAEGTTDEGKDSRSILEKLTTEGGEDELLTIERRLSIRYLLHASLMNEGFANVIDGLLLPPPWTLPDLRTPIAGGHSPGSSTPTPTATPRSVGSSELKSDKTTRKDNPEASTTASPPSPLMLFQPTRDEVVQHALNIPVELHELVAAMPLNLALKSGLYDARQRSAMRKLCSLFGLPFTVIIKKEEAVGHLDLDELASGEGGGTNTAGEKKKKSALNVKNVKRAATIGAVAAVGGVVLFFTAGLAAPAVAPAFAAVVGTVGTATASAAGAVGAALGSGALASIFLGIVGIATHAAAIGTLLAPALSAANLTAIFGAGGAGLAGWKAKKRTDGADHIAIRNIADLAAMPPLSDLKSIDQVRARREVVLEMPPEASNGPMVPYYSRSIAQPHVTFSANSYKRVCCSALDNLTQKQLTLVCAGVGTGCWKAVPPGLIAVNHSGIWLTHNKRRRPTGSENIVCYHIEEGGSDGSSSNLLSLLWLYSSVSAVTGKVECGFIIQRHHYQEGEEEETDASVPRLHRVLERKDDGSFGLQRKAAKGTGSVEEVTQGEEADQEEDSEGPLGEVVQDIRRQFEASSHHKISTPGLPPQPLEGTSFTLETQYSTLGSQGVVFILRDRVPQGVNSSTTNGGGALGENIPFPVAETEGRLSSLDPKILSRRRIFGSFENRSTSIPLELTHFSVDQGKPHPDALPPPMLPVGTGALVAAKNADLVGGCKISVVYRGVVATDEQGREEAGQEEQKSSLKEDGKKKTTRPFQLKMIIDLNTVGRSSCSVEIEGLTVEVNSQQEEHSTTTTAGGVEGSKNHQDPENMDEKKSRNSGGFHIPFFGKSKDTDVEQKKKSKTVPKEKELPLTSKDGFLRTQEGNFEVSWRITGNHDHTIYFKIRDLASHEKDSSINKMSLCIGVTGFAPVFDVRYSNDDQQVACWKPVMEQASSMQGGGLISNNGCENLVLEWEPEPQREFASLLGLDTDDAIATSLTNHGAKESGKLLIQNVGSGAVFASARAAEAFTGLFTAPMLALWATNAIDNSFAVLKKRSKDAGEQLAEALQSDLRGNRPVTLIGFGFGANVIAACLKELGSERGPGIIENAYLLGSIFNSDEETWKPLRAAVSGRLINVYNRSDWYLWLLNRAHSTSLRPLSGLGRITGVPGVENIDASSVVDNLGSYGFNLKQVLSLIPAFPTKQTLARGLASSPGVIVGWKQLAATASRMSNSMTKRSFTFCILNNYPTSGLTLRYVGSVLYNCRWDFDPPYYRGRATTALSPEEKDLYYIPSGKGLSCGITEGGDSAASRGLSGLLSSSSLSEMTGALFFEVVAEQDFIEKQEKRESKKQREDGHDSGEAEEEVDESSPLLTCCLVVMFASTGKMSRMECVARLRSVSLADVLTPSTTTAERPDEDDEGTETEKISCSREKHAKSPIPTLQPDQDGEEADDEGDNAVVAENSKDAEKIRSHELTSDEVKAVEASAPQSPFLNLSMTAKDLADLSEKDVALAFNSKTLGQVAGGYHSIQHIVEGCHPTSDAQVTSQFPLITRSYAEKCAEVNKDPTDAAEYPLEASVLCQDRVTIVTLGFDSDQAALEEDTAVGDEDHHSSDTPSPTSPPPVSLPVKRDPTPRTLRRDAIERFDSLFVEAPVFSIDLTLGAELQKLCREKDLLALCSSINYDPPPVSSSSKGSLSSPRADPRLLVQHHAGMILLMNYTDTVLTFCPEGASQILPPTLSSDQVGLGNNRWALFPPRELPRNSATLICLRQQQHPRSRISCFTSPSSVTKRERDVNEDPLLLAQLSYSGEIRRFNARGSGGRGTASSHTVNKEWAMLLGANPGSGALARTSDSAAPDHQSSSPSSQNKKNDPDRVQDTGVAQETAGACLSATEVRIIPLSTFGDVRVQSTASTTSSGVAGGGDPAAHSSPSPKRADSTVESSQFGGIEPLVVVKFF